MKIAVVHSFYSSSQPSGENRVVEDQVQLLRDAGHDVRLIARWTDQESRAAGYPVRSALRVATGWGSGPLEELHEFEPDIVHVHNLFPNFATSWIARWHGPVVISLHNYRPFCSNGLFYRDAGICFDCVERGDNTAIRHGCYRDSRVATVPVAIGRRVDRRNVLAAASTVVTTSEGAREVVEPLLGPNITTTLIPNFGPGEAEPPLPASERSGWLAMGRFSPGKGFVELIEEWPECEHLTVIGDGELRESVFRAATIKGVAVEGSLSIEELRTRIPVFRGLIFPSRWLEVAPQVVVEAMRVGLPVITYEENVVASLVRSNGVGGLYRDAPSLSSCVALMSDQLDGFSERASQYYQANWTPSAWLSSMVGLYERLLIRAGQL